MGRTRRPYLPGCIFHLTARTVRREHWFTPDLRSAIVDTLVGVVEPSRMKLIAVAVMSNHLHIVAQQGDRPLATLMQPLLRRVARRVHEAHGIEGPIFWRHYASRACLDPAYARNAVAYVHLNPVRAGLCDDPGNYPWTSHALYADRLGDGVLGHLARLATVLDPTLALPLFASGPGRSTRDLRDDYRAFMARRRSIDAAGVGDDAGSNGAAGASPPPSPGSVRSWGGSLSPLFHEPVRPPSEIHDDSLGPAAPDLATIAKQVLAAEAPGLSLATLRASKGGPERVRIRHLIIRRLSAAGYANVQIARFLRLSDSAVSYVLRKSR
jgi:REP element-mobilizing transposase RayT